MWLFVSLAHAADCPPDLDARLQELDAAEVVQSADVLALFPCHDGPIEPEWAARVHRLLARASAEGGDVPRAARHLYAAWEASPFLAPAGPEPALSALQTMQEAPPPPPVDPPAPYLTVDGRPATWLRAGQPAILQGAGRAPALFDDQHPLVPERPVKKSRGFLIAAAATGVVAGGMYGGALVSKARYEQVSTAPVEERPERQAELERTYATTNGLAIGSGVAAAGALGLLTVHLTR